MLVCFPLLFVFSSEKIVNIRIWRVFYRLFSQIYRIPKGTFRGSAGALSHASAPWGRSLWFNLNVLPHVTVTNLGPLHMSPVNQAGSVSEISLATLFFVKISMCSYERFGWPGYRDLGFCDRDLGVQYEHTREFVQVTEPARAERHLGKTKQPG